MTKLAGQVVAISGAARGIGLATAKALLQKGARVALGDVDDVALKEEVDKLGENATAVVLDVTDPSSFAAFLDQAEDRFGSLAVVVNNAGIMPVGGILDESDATTRRMVDINLHGVITGTKLALERMMPRVRGHIVNIASLSGIVPAAGTATYTATKHAVVGFTDSVRLEVADRGIQITLVMPGFVATELISGTRAPKSIGVLQPWQLADAIVSGIEENKREVIEPKSLIPLANSLRLIPYRARVSLAKKLGMDKVFLAVDRDARKDYDDRTIA